MINYRTHFIIWLVLLTALLPLPLLAQGGLTLRLDAVDASRFPEVQVALTVRDANGVPVSSLEPENFDVSEDRTLESRPVTGLDTVVNPEVQIAVVLALDVSGSMSGQPLQDAQTAAVRFLDWLGPTDRAALIAFSDAINLAEPFPQFDRRREHPFTPDKAGLYAVVDGLEAGGSTPLYDAAYKAVRLAAAQPPGNRAVLLLTDGRDEDAQQNPGQGSAVANEDTPIREANKHDVPVFTIGLGSRIDARYLRRLAVETGGVYQETPDSAQLVGLFQNVGDLLKQQYRLTYTSGLTPDGARHRTLVTVKVGTQTVFDEIEWGPLGQAAPTDTPTATATDTPVPTTTPTATPAVTPVSSGTAGERTGGGMGWLPWAIGVGVLGLLAVVAAGARMAVTRRQAAGGERCMRCGGALDANGNCPHCGPGPTYTERV